MNREGDLKRGFNWKCVECIGTDVRTDDNIAQTSLRIAADLRCDPVVHVLTAVAGLPVPGLVYACASFAGPRE